MSAVVKILKDVVDVIVDVVEVIWDAIGDVLEFVWKEIGMPILEFVFGLLGVHDEDIISTEVITQKVLQEVGDYNEIINTIALAHQQDPNGSVISHYTQQAQAIKAKFAGYYTKGKDSINGLPYTNIRSMFIDPAVVKAALIAEYDIEDITVETAVKRVPDKYEWVASQLRMSHNYTASSQTLEIDSNVYTVDSIDYNYDTNNYDITALYSYDTVTNDVTTTTTDTQIISITAYIPVLYAVAKYYIGEDDSTWYYWVYKVGSGVYPAVDTSNVSLGSLELMPIIPIRNNFVNTNANKTSAVYLESAELSQILGVDLDDITASINSSPDIGNVADAFLHLSVDLAEDAPVLNKLVYETFAQMYEDSGLYQEVVNKTGGVPNSGYSAAIKEGSFNVVLGWKSQEKVITQCIIGPINTYKKSVKTRTAIDNSTGIPSSQTVYDLVMTKQVTEEYYITYTMGYITGLTLIDRDGMFGTVGRDLTEGIHMPLSFFFLDALDLQEQVEVFPYVLKISIYAAQITHLEWYETEAFGRIMKIIAIIVAVVVTILTWGAASSFGAFLISMAEMIAIGVAVGYAMKILMESNAPDWLKAVGAVILVVVGMYLGMSAGSGEFLSAAQLTQAVTESAYTIIGTASALVSGLANAVTVYTEVKMNELEDKETKFQAAADLRQEVIDDAYDNLVQGLDVTDIEWLIDKDIPEAYLKGPDAFMYKAKGGIQYEYSALYAYESKKDDYISSMLNVGIL